jgi:hypothetical protein
MLRTSRFLSFALAAAMLMAPAAANAKSSKTKKKLVYPSISKVAPLKAGIGDKIVVTGKNYRSGKNKNYVVFKRDGGRAVFVKAEKATSRKITVTIPAKLLGFLVQKAGTPQPTKFRLRVLAARLGKAYASSKFAVLVGPSAIAAGTSDDCDGDGTPNSRDTDDDNDLLADSDEARLGTDACKRDTDGDGLSDGWEQYSAIDRNGGAVVPAPTKKPYPNALDATDGPKVDSDGDGLSNLEEYTAWATYGGNRLPLSYSGGNPASAGRTPVPNELKYMDRDLNGYLSDFERDADGDGIPNMDEQRTEYNMAGTWEQAPDDTAFRDFGVFTAKYLELAEKATKDEFRCAGINQVPFYCVDLVKPDAPDIQKVDTLDWLASDTDGDSIRDDTDDVDHDGVSNISEYLSILSLPYKKRKYAPLDACVPNVDSPFCLLGTIDGDRDGIPNAQDDDDDGDGLPDAAELSAGTEPLLADTDGDGVGDGFEYFSALDFNSTALPYPGERPYPNPLDRNDANKDFDGDSLTLAEEFKAWMVSGAPKPMNYSDGTQYTGGKVATGGTDEDGNGYISDDEKDVDGDGLSNYVEAHGPLSNSGWWDAWINDKVNKCTDDYTESPYPGPVFAGTDFTKKDSDGDGLADGADDIDHDGYTNAQETFRPAGWCAHYTSMAVPLGTVAVAGPPAVVHDNPKARVQPFNPCKPTYSDFCHQHPPTGYYKDKEDWASDVDANGP